ncbi:MAG: sigma-54-dependent Fis family transcriptional regulator [Spirochaetales bacterium]|nr:sigma-54-dependent Fis family transcriptional regulator [Spirochaetales bacterium]
MGKTAVLVLDDEARLTEEIGEYLGNAGFEVRIADRPSAAFTVLRNDHIDIALIDIKLPEYDGLVFLKHLKAQYPDVESVVMSGHGDMDSVIEALRLGAFDYLRKPFSTFELQTAINRTTRFLDAKDTTRRYAQLCAELNHELAEDSDMVGSSPSMLEVGEQMARAAAHPDTPVLIHGESGTGKELVARRIHNLSARASGRFIAVNCAAIPRDMFESEFFGHAKGAFTDAHTARAGLFRSADGGTLFLDEVGEVPLSSQTKLLRILEDGAVRPVGSDEEQTVDVRILCATNRDLGALVKDGLFRRDLYYRLAVIEIPLPPLRDRIEDIEKLANLFHTRFCLRAGTTPRPMDPGLLARLKLYSFPGNVRELKNLVERITILGRAPTEKELSAWLDPDSVGSDFEDASGAVVDKPRSGLNLQRLERDAVSLALERSGGVRAVAARLLGITRQALDRRMERYGIEARNRAPGSGQ